MKRHQIVAHRAAPEKSGFAENSVAAIQRIKTLGYGIEIDVRVSGDGQLMVVHDPVVLRDKQSYPVEMTDAAMLQEMGVATWQEVKPLLVGYPSWLEAKTPAAADRLLQETYDSAWTFMSFSDRLVHEAQQREWKSVFLYGGGNAQTFRDICPLGAQWGMHRRTRPCNAQELERVLLWPIKTWAPLNRKSQLPSALRNSTSDTWTVVTDNPSAWEQYL